MCHQIFLLLAPQGIEQDEEPLSVFNYEGVLVYDSGAADHFRRILSWIDVVFRIFKSSLREEIGHRIRATV